MVAPLSTCLRELDPDGSNWSMWDVVRKPVKWLLGKLFTTDKNDDTFDEEPFVIVELVKVCRAHTS